MAAPKAGRKRKVYVPVTPGEMSQADVDALREAGHSDEAIHDAAQVIAYFNYINRIADGLGTDLEVHMPKSPPWETTGEGE